MFWNERLGEFAQEVKASVNLPLPMAELPVRVTAKDGSSGGGGGGGEAVQRELLLPSKNLALQQALLGVLLERCVHVGGHPYLRSFPQCFKNSTRAGVVLERGMALVFS